RRSCDQRLGRESRRRWQGGQGRGGSPRHRRDQREAMTANIVTVTRVRTGGPREDGPKILEHLAGWTLVVVVAMLVTRLGLL
ncbi:membrane protein, partial [Streptomyces viridosporus ATCC 14672]